jgi:diacylglycerol kinase family enzyme
VAVVLLGAGLASVLFLVTGMAALALSGMGGWWALSHHGPARWAGALLAVAAPGAVIAFYVGSGVLVEVLVALVLWALALACGRAAIRRLRQPHGQRPREAPRPRRPVLIMNPRSGDGKVEDFGLAAKARALGAKVILLEPDVDHDVAALAREAVADGADLLGVAGGDGTQAQVAAVAAESGLPFLVVPAGTRNHFAMDLGLDRADPSRSLDALTDGVEVRVDLGRVAGRPFVNTVSFGVYAEIVQSPEYRDAKNRTILQQLPERLLGASGARLEAQADDIRLTAPQAVLVSNNPYTFADPLGGGRRPRLDLGVLGVLGIRVEGAAQAAEIAVLGLQARSITSVTAHQVVVEADRPEIPVAVDGEALTHPTPVSCSLLPRVLRVRVPRHRPGAAVTSVPVDWRRIIRLALGRE